MEKPASLCLKISRTNWQLRRKKLFSISRVKKNYSWGNEKNCFREIPTPRFIKTCPIGWQEYRLTHLYWMKRFGIKTRSIFFSFGVLQDASIQYERPNHRITNDPRYGEVKNNLIVSCLGVKAYHVGNWLRDKPAKNNKIDIEFDYQPYPINFFYRWRAFFPSTFFHIRIPIPIVLIVRVWNIGEKKNAKRWFPLNEHRAFSLNGAPA